MIKKLKEDETEYVRKCSKCASIFTYNKVDYYGGYDSNYVKCPVCDHHQHIYFHKVYKRDEEVQEDYKKLIKTLEQEKIDFRNTITNKCCEIDSLKRENEKMKSNIDYENVRLKNSIEPPKKKSSRKNGKNAKDKR